MTSQNSPRGGQPFRVWKIVFFILAAILIVTLSVVFVACPGPSAKDLEPLIRQLQSARANYPTARRQPAAARATSATLAMDAPATTGTAPLAPAAAGETDQQRCDRLFLEILHAVNTRMDIRTLEFFTPSSIGFKFPLDEARELAALDAKSVRVSDAARKSYKLFHGRVLGLISDALVKNASYQEVRPVNYDSWEKQLRLAEGEPLTLTPAQTDNLLEALRFQHVTGCPVQASYRHGDMKSEANWRVGWLLDPGGDQWSALPEIPREILTMDPELLAPRGLDAWGEFLGQMLEAQKETLEFRAELVTPINY